MSAIERTLKANREAASAAKVPNPKRGSGRSGPSATRVKETQNHPGNDAPDDDRNAACPVIEIDEAWPELVPIAGPEPAEMFASDFPPCVGKIVGAVSDMAEVPVELPGLMALGVLATASHPAHVVARWIGHSVKVQNDNYAQVDDHHFDQFNAKAKAIPVQASTESEKCATASVDSSAVVH